MTVGADILVEGVVSSGSALASDDYCTACVCKTVLQRVSLLMIRVPIFCKAFPPATLCGVILPRLFFFSRLASAGKGGPTLENCSVEQTLLKADQAPS